MFPLMTHHTDHTLVCSLLLPAGTGGAGHLPPALQGRGEEVDQELSSSSLAALALTAP